MFHYEEGGVAGWKLMTGDCVYKLHPGAVSDNATSEDFTVSSGTNTILIPMLACCLLVPILLHGIVLCVIT